MKKNLFHLCTLLLFVLVFSACSKDSDSPSANYSPLTVGSNWTYAATEGTSAPVSFKLTVTSKDTAANGKTYKVLSNSASSNNYLGTSGNNYYRLASYPSFGINNSEDLYLVDNKAVNETWASTSGFSFQGIPLTVTANYTMKERGISRTVQGKSYSDVLHVRLDLNVTNLGNIGGGEFYYSNGVGLIDNTLAITPPVLLGLPNYNYKQELTAYEIK